MQALIRDEIKDYGVIYLNRTDKRNAMSLEMAKQLSNSLNKMKQANLPFLVITSSDESMFCSGGDLRELHADLSESEAFDKLITVQKVLYEIITFPVPVISLLNGNAVGGGCELATACDMRIAKEATQFGFIQTNLGILPAWGGGAILYEKIHPSIAFHWLTEARMYSAEELYVKGWIQRVVSTEEWHNKASVLKDFTSKSVEQMKHLKQQYLNSVDLEQLYRKMRQESKQTASLWGNKTHQLVLENFFSK